MRFEHPDLLWWLFVLVPGLTAFFWWAWRKKQWLIAQFVQSRLLAQLTVGVSAVRQKIRMILMVAAVVLLVIVLARPQWGFEWQEARQRGLDIVVAIDTSQSMLATDVAPNRLDRAKLAALDLLKLARTDRLGLVAFAGGAFLQCPLTIDEGAFRQSLNALNTTIIPQGGTALAEAIRAAAAAFEKENDNFKILIMFTDGEDHDGHALEAAREAEREGLRIFTVGVGTANGELLSIPDKKGSTTYLKDNQGNVVKSRLNEPLLQELAQSTGGFYLLLSGANTVDLLYERGLEPLPKADFAARQVKRYHERYQGFLGLAILLLILEILFPERRRVPKSEAILASSSNEPLRRAVSLFLILILWPAGAFASTRQALKQYNEGNYEGSRVKFERLLKSHPDDPRLHFNTGSAAYQSGDYEAATSHYQSALVTKDLSLQQGAYYNLGNTQFRLGEKTSDLEEKQAAWQKAVNHYKSSLKLNSEDQDAKYNLKYVEEKLKELQQQQQQQQQQDQSDEGDNQDQESDPQSSDPQDSDQDQQDADDSSESQQQQQPQQEPSDQNSQDQKESSPKEQNQDASQEEKNSSPSGQEENQNEEGEPSDPAQGNPGEMMQMTPEQARRLLEAIKGEERTLIFLPPSLTNRPNRIQKNW